MDTVNRGTLPQPFQQLLAICDAQFLGTVNTKEFQKNVPALERAETFRMPAPEVASIIACPGVKQQLKWAEQHVIKQYKELKQTHGMCEFKPNTLKHLAKVLLNTFPTHMRRPTAPSETGLLMANVFDPQCFVGLAVHHHIGATPYGIGEVRVILSGHCCFAGMPMHLVVGGTFRGKIDRCLMVEG